MSRSCHELAICVILSVFGTVQAQETGCTTPLAECTKSRVAHLKTQSRALLLAARQQPSRTLSVGERAQLKQYDQWLEEYSRKALDLAMLGSAARLQEMQLSFNMQYLQLQAQLQHENRSFTTISNVLKLKHDTAKNSISNVR